MFSQKLSRITLVIGAAATFVFIALPAHLAPGVLATNPVVSKLTNNSAVITWSTAVDTTGEVEYGLQTDYGTRSVQVPLATDHKVVLTNLNVATVYHFRTVSRDKSNNTLYSPDQTLSTPSTVDNIAPAAITDLRATLHDINSITLAWTATGNDGAYGTVASYDIRYSANVPLLMGDLWETNQSVTEVPTPLVSGQLQTYTFTGLQPITTYYIALRARDAADNVSPVSNVIEVRTDPVVSGAFDIRDIQVRFLTSYSATVTWFTNMQSDTQLVMGQTTQYEMPTVYDEGKNYRHSVILGGLEGSAVYHLKIMAINAQAQSAQTGDFTIKTLSR